MKKIIIRMRSTVNTLLNSATLGYYPSNFDKNLIFDQEVIIVVHYTPNEFNTNIEDAAGEIRYMLATSRELDEFEYIKVNVVKHHRKDTEVKKYLHFRWLNTPTLGHLYKVFGIRILCENLKLSKANPVPSYIECK